MKLCRHQDQRNPLQSPIPHRRNLVLLPLPPPSAPRHLSPHQDTRGYLISGQHIELTALEDRESVQVALSVVINALATGNLDIKRATALLYGLQLASSNARGLYIEP